VLVAQQQELRQYIDQLRVEGYTVRDDGGSDPDLISPDGNAVDTWREGFPYDTRMCREYYDV